MQQLPIEQVPHSNPPRFRWKYVADTPNGKMVVDQEGALPPSMEVAMQRMISITKQLLLENAALHGKIKAMEAQTELLESETVAGTTTTAAPQRAGGTRKAR
jgi:hypothetical protein